jgi:D-alanyl-D-alanine carboxypeptidase (penicillin-binding protein 5/6)
MKKQRRTAGIWTVLIILPLVITGYVAWALLRPLPAVQPDKASIDFTTATPSPNLAWPTSGEAAAGVVGSSAIATHGDQKPVPTASTAKVITALVVLQKKPLGLNQAGPLVTITDADIASYNRYVSQDGSVLPVVAGEQLSEYQMLQAIMLPSANNIADKLATWAYGSLPDYAQAANSYLVSKGIIHTHVGSDASGLAPDTTSTAEDLVKIGQLAMQEPVLAQVVAQSSATGLPQTSIVRNVNSLLGTNGIVGIKTGNSDQAGGVFIGAAKTTFNGKPTTVVTAIAAAPNLSAALTGSVPLLQTAGQNFTKATITASNKILTTYTAPWGAQVHATTRTSVVSTAWQGESVRAKVNVSAIGAGSKAGTESGSLVVGPTAIASPQTITIYLDKALPAPGIGWRLTHPF